MAGPSISDRIKAGRSKKAEHKDVDVVLDEHLSAEITAFEEQIDGKEAEVSTLEEEKERLKPELRFSDPRGKELDGQITALQETIATLEEQRDQLRTGAVVTLRFDKLNGEKWAEIASKHPPRVDVTIDRLSGYNYHATAREVAPLCGYALGEDDAREDLTEEDWAGLFEQISGREAENIAASLWELNDWAPRRKIDAAKKGSAGGSGSR